MAEQKRQHAFDLVNDAYYQLVGHRDILGKPVREALPEVEGQGFFELLDRVFTSGEPFVGRQLQACTRGQRGQDGHDRRVEAQRGNHSHAIRRRQRERAAVVRREG